MTNKKISALTGAATALAGTELLPIVQSGATVKVAVSDLTAGRAVSALSYASTTGSSFAATSGNVGIATTSPVTLKLQQTLQVLGNAKLGATNDTGLLSLGDIGSTGANAGIWRGAAGAFGSGGNYLCLGGYDGITFATGNAEIASQTKQFTMDTTGNLIPATAAKGVNFTANTPAAGMTSQLLNWYEEGTWTPAYTGWTLNPTTAAGQYTRIGRTVVITLLGLGGTSTTGSITGLPFTSKSTQGATVTIRGTNSNINAVGAIIDLSATIDNIGTMTASGNYWALSGTYII